MISKTRAFWSGVGEGAWKGASATLLTLGLLSAGLTLIGGIIAAATVPGTGVFALFAVEALVLAFFGGMFNPVSLGIAGVAGTIYGAYNGIDNFLEVREEEQRRKEIEKVARRAAIKTPEKLAGSSQRTEPSTNKTLGNSPTVSSPVAPSPKRTQQEDVPTIPLKAEEPPSESPLKNSTAPPKLATERIEKQREASGEKEKAHSPAPAGF